MQIRALTKNELEMVRVSPDEALPDPLYTVAVGAFDEEGLAGRLLMVIVPHFEEPWIRPDLRGGTLLRRMENVLLEEADRFGLNRVLAFAPNEDIESYLERSGFTRSEMTVWEKKER